MRNANGVRATGLPVLVIQGTNDERIPVESARQFAAEIGERATYVELEADHFLIMKQPQQVQEAIRAWLEDQE
jgi:pimeloyl-ACP methyl ester carboxylesterase